MNQPTVHPRTKRALDQYLERPAHGLLLIGSAGVGKQSVARWLAQQLEKPAMTISVPEGKTMILIEQIQELYQTTRTAAPMAIVIDQAHLMTQDAQNAFLKLLEEPPAQCTFILMSTNEDSLLPTIRSRCQIIPVLPLGKQQLAQELSSNPASATDINVLLHTGGGNIGLINQLLEDSQLLEAHQQILSEAKQFYGGGSYERQLMLIEHKFDKTWAAELLHFLAIIIETLLRAKTDDASARRKLLSQAKLIEMTAHNLLRVPGNPKAHLPKLAMQL